MLPDGGRRMENDQASMTVFGLDFTSVPSVRKPITCAQGELSGTILTIHTCQPLIDWAAFETWLALAGSWLAACDFPFGLPREVLLVLHWPLDWSAYVEVVSSMTMHEFVTTLVNYCATQPAGHKLRKRPADELAGARSPLMWFRVPVAKMFFTGAPRLLAAPVSVLPCRPLPMPRLVFEGYPALVARTLIGARSYKREGERRIDPVQLQARRDIMAALTAPSLCMSYDLRVIIDETLCEELVQDQTGDCLDAVLCTVQAAWAYTQRDSGYGIPTGHEADGWIIDPALL